MFFLAKKQTEETKTEPSFLETLKDLSISSIKSYTKGALMGAIIKKPDFKTMNSSGIQMVKLDLFRNSLTRFFDHFLSDSVNGLDASIDYMPLSAFIAGATINLTEEEPIYDWEESDNKTHPLTIKSRLISGLSYSTYSIIEKLSKTDKNFFSTL